MAAGSYSLLDSAALALLTHDAVLLSDEDLNRSTPCEGWTVRDLLSHINDEHEAIIEPILGPARGRTRDPRHDLPESTARWTLALQEAGATVAVPRLGERVGTERVRAVHFVDMLVHRWDLATATGRPVDADERLTSAALPVARQITSPGSPLVGRAYRPCRTGGPWRAPIDELAALLGRQAISAD